MGGTLEAPWEGGSGSGNWKLTGRLEPLDSFIDSFKEMTILRLGSGGVLWRLPGGVEARLAQEGVWTNPGDGLGCEK